MRITFKTYAVESDGSLRFLRDNEAEFRSDREAMQYLASMLNNLNHTVIKDVLIYG